MPGGSTISRCVSSSTAKARLLQCSSVFRCHQEFLAQCDVVTVNCPLHEGTHDLINEKTVQWFKPGAWLVNTARGAICNAEAVKKAVESGQLNGYAGDVWNVQPAPKDHPWRMMKNPLGGGNGMCVEVFFPSSFLGNIHSSLLARVPHVSGTSLDAQARYAAGVRKILQNWLEGKEQTPSDIIVTGGQYATKAYGQR